MKTEIYPSYAEFRQRENKSINGVTQAFADSHPGWDDETNNVGCWNCFRCSGCFRCSDCSGCSGCFRCSGLENSAPAPVVDAVLSSIPVIPSIHQEVLRHASTQGGLNMQNWHTCNTTHCRAGWVVHLAGASGKALEKKTSTLFAAMQIYKASSPIGVSPTRFFESNEQAMADMERCAAEEAQVQA